MNISEYEVLHADLSNAAGKQLARMAHSRKERKRAAWVIERMEQFIAGGADSGERVAPELGAGRIEVYAAPPLPDLAKPPGALALLRVDHDKRTIELIAVVVDLPSAEGPIRDQIVQIARGAILGR